MSINSGATMGIHSGATMGISSGGPLGVNAAMITMSGAIINLNPPGGGGGGGGGASARSVPDVDNLPALPEILPKD